MRGISIITVQGKLDVQFTGVFRVFPYSDVALQHVAFEERHWLVRVKHCVLPVSASQTGTRGQNDRLGTMRELDLKPRNECMHCIFPRGSQSKSTLEVRLVPRYCLQVESMNQGYLCAYGGGLDIVH